MPRERFTLCDWIALFLTVVLPAIFIATLAELYRRLMGHRP